MFFVTLAAWQVGVGVSFYFGNRTLPTAILIIGIAATAAHFTIGIGYYYIALMALLGVIIWIANRVDMS
ncbi:MAG: hypothetical protein KDN19_04045 [Verrucomicrobiae bacterium]|nr:hypothetical protein [Verrucomicrobiae bacterium]